MITKEDLKDLELSEEILTKVISIADNKFAIEKQKIEKETFGKALGNVDNALIELGLTKNGKTTDFIKKTFAELKSKADKVEVLNTEIEKLKSGKGDDVSELNKKNKELAQLILDLKMQHSEILETKENELNTQLKEYKLRAKIDKRGLLHLPESLQKIVINQSVDALLQKDIDIDETGKFIFKDENGLPITDEKNGYKLKGVTEMLNDIPVWSENYKSEGTQKNTTIHNQGNGTNIPKFEDASQIVEFLGKQNLSGDEYTDKYNEYAKNL